MHSLEVDSSIHSLLFFLAAANEFKTKQNLWRDLGAGYGNCTARLFKVVLGS